MTLQHSLCRFEYRTESEDIGIIHESVKKTTSQVFLFDQLDIIAPLLLCLKHILVFFVNTIKLSHGDCRRS